MFLGAPFALAPPSVEPDLRWLHTVVELNHAVHDAKTLVVSEKVLHCAYFSLMAADSFLGLKLYVWVAFPMAALVAILMFKGE